ncbi:hypothetical protein LTR33_004579 [Friedmanniomyces endolithicus]|nr:hypothetical protein LTR33_004579 [Friedmanniomyces endolithicus]
MAPIATIEHFRVLPRWLFVKITDSEGRVGWGEATLEGHTEAIEGTLKGYANRFIGLEADDIEEIWQQAWRKSFYRGGPVFMSALSGIDIALWDLKARKLGVPIWQLLGGKGPLFIEEPLLSEHPEGIKELYGLTTCPIALGERLYSRWDFKRFFEDHSVDIIQPDISHYRRHLRNATDSRHGRGEMSLGMHYNVLAGEYDINSYITNPEVFDVKDGFVEKLTGPGLGIEINEELVRKVAETTEPWPLMGFVGKDGAYREW